MDSIEDLKRLALQGDEESQVILLSVAIKIIQDSKDEQNAFYLRQAGMFFRTLAYSSEGPKVAINVEVAQRYAGFCMSVAEGILAHDKELAESYREAGEGLISVLKAMGKY